MGVLGHTYGSSGSFGFASVHLGAPRGRRVHSRSRGFSLARIGVFGFARVHWGTLRGRLVCSGSRVFTLGVAGYISVRVGSLRRAFGSSG